MNKKRGFIFKYRDRFGYLQCIQLSPFETMKEAEEYFKEEVGDYTIISIREISI
jgi:hypothetical protein